MIMAGRGKRLGNVNEVTSKVGSSETPNEPFDLPVLTQKINELNISDLNSKSLTGIQNSFKNLCTTKEKLKEIISSFHDKALDDPGFGEKLFFALEEIINFEVEEVSIRKEALEFLQKDFQAKDSLIQSDRKKFLGTVMLLGSAYGKIKVAGSTFTVMAVALLEYFNVLLKGEEEELKILTMQILFNGKRLSNETKILEKYKALEHNLRKTLINQSLSENSKYWILLGIDFMSNGFKPLTPSLKEFYTTHLGDEFTKLEPIVEAYNKGLYETKSFSANVNSPTFNETSSEKKKFGLDDKKENNDEGNCVDNNINKNDDGRRTKHFELNSTKSPEKIRSSHKKQNYKDNRRENFGEKSFENSKKKSISGHDDRFDKEEDYYGVQLPRFPKSENFKKNFQNLKGNKQKESDSSKGIDTQTRESATTEENWD